jgi:2-polyprenyl-3-methyl-5-hydroxy-6-metoxy-1,4-benzoquinol methylase
VRATLLQQAAQPDALTTDDQSLTFYCALARQCFINEYVFAYPPNQADEVRRLQERLSAALASGAPVPPLWVAALAAYTPLHTLPFAEVLLARDWPDAVRLVLQQQISEPADEARHRAAMPRLTRIEDASSQAVRAQYEVNPYPRWTKLSTIGGPKTVEQHLRARFPLAPLRPLDKPKLDYLIAGCGTGQQVASVAQAFSNAGITAIDLSLTSLGYAKRMITGMGLQDVAFGQADILELGTLGRAFDVIDSSGVLHHISDGGAGWRVLLSILRPGGVMRVALYSTVARRHIEAARQYIAAKGYTGSAADIRQCRQDIMAMPEDEPIRSVLTLIDFFSTSDCRDLLFHVEEHGWTIPQLAAFFVENNLEFLGFETELGTMRRYTERFPDDPAQTNLEHWHAFEQDNPDTFIAMYDFWLQKPGTLP